MITTARPAIAALVPGSFAPTRQLRLGTRGSALAVAQSTTIAEALRAIGADVELVTVRTLGAIARPTRRGAKGPSSAPSNPASSTGRSISPSTAPRTSRRPSIPG
jgi:hypothetical protein